MKQVKKIGAIAAMTAAHLIGIDNTIPWHYPEDFKRFKGVTLDSAIIMGRKTWESIGSKPLPKRQNIVLTRSKLPAAPFSAASIKRALELVETETVWFIGGGNVYAQALPFCDVLDITWVPDEIAPSDSRTASYFPPIELAYWQAGDIEMLKADPRLKLQRFTRRRA